MSIRNLQDLSALISGMTIDEKLAQIGSYWMFELQSEDGSLDIGKVSKKIANGIGQITRIGGASAFTPVEIAKTGNQIQKYLLENTRLGIPAIFHEETCTGTMVLGGSMYPQVIGLAATFQPELAEELTRAIRKQMLAIGARHALAPVLDLGAIRDGAGSRRPLARIQYWRASSEWRMSGACREMIYPKA